MSEIRKDLTFFLISIAVSVLFCRILIPFLKRLKAGQTILGYVEKHKSKSGTPTMGGFAFAAAAIITFFIAKRGEAKLAAVCVAIAVSFLIVGAMDDYIKVKSHENEGLTPLQKICFQTVISLIFSCFLYFKGYLDFFIPFKNVFISLGLAGAVLCFFVFLATTNCVNLTDGLDGLAGGVSFVFLIVFYAIIKLQISVFSANFVAPSECANVAFLCLTQAGALLGYLCFNTYKASVFMGDTGSLYLGGLIASVGILSGNAFFIPLVGATFVASGVSVMVQVFYYKLTKKRVFLMAPLHHHFEYEGYSESKICFFYKLITLIFGLICIISIMRG